MTSFAQKLLLGPPYAMGILWIATAQAQTSYNLEVIARTGGTTPAGSLITALGTGPSINDAAKVAYVVSVQNGRQGVFVTEESGTRSLLIENFNVDPFSTITGLSSNFFFPNEVQINDQNRVAWHASSRDGLFSFIFRLGTTSSDFRIVAKTYYDNPSTPGVDFPSPFVGPFPTPTSGLKSWVALNNGGRTAFSGILAPSATSTVLSTPRDPETSGHNSSSDFYVSAGRSSYPRYFPVVSDGNYTIVRWGDSSTDPLLLFSDETLSSAWTISSTPDFSYIGGKPSISDDNYVIAFWGVRGSTGPGIYAEATAGVARILGAGSQFSAFYPEARVGVNLSGDGNPDSYTIAFLAKRATGGPPNLDPLGLYTVRINVANPAAPVVSNPKLVVETGTSVSGLSGVITNIDFYDPINNHGQLAFSLATTAESAIIRATIRPVVLVHGWRGNPETWLELKNALINQGYLENENLFLFDYSQDGAINKPSVYADKLLSFVQTIKSQHNIRGTIDIVCHSMGAMVSRWYMEKLGSAGDVNQWIGLAPVNNGAGIADGEILIPDVLKGFFARLIGTEPAVTDMAIRSSALARLNYDLNQFEEAVWGNPQHVSPNVIYRTILGMNYQNGSPANNTAFFPVTAGQTRTVKKDSKGRLYAFWTHQGDGLVGVTQGKLSGGTVGNEVVEGLNHTQITHDAGVINKVVGYILNPSNPVVNNCPATDPEDDHEYVGVGNQGYVYHSAPQQVPFFVDSEVAKMSVLASSSSAGIDMQLVAPNGTVQSVCTSGSNSVWCSIATPQPGNWLAIVSLQQSAIEPAAFSVSTFFSTQIGLSLSIGDPDGFLYLGQPVHLIADVDHDGAVTMPPQLITTITTPNGTTNPVTLSLESSNVARIRFSGTYSPTLVGSHLVSATANGQTPDSFKRMAFVRFSVKQPMRFTSVRIPSPSAVDLRIQGNPYDKGILEVSGDLGIWTNAIPSAVYLDTNGNMTLQPPISATVSKSFYRVRSIGE